MPSADSCRAVRVNHFTPSRESTTHSRSPEVSSTAFSAQPPDLPPADLMDMGFAILCPLARCRRPHHPVLIHRLAPLLHATFRLRLTTTPLRFANPSPPSGWVEDFHLQAVKHARHTQKRAAIAAALLIGALAESPHLRRKARRRCGPRDCCFYSSSSSSRPAPAALAAAMIFSCCKAGTKS